MGSQYPVIRDYLHRSKPKSEIHLSAAKRMREFRWLRKLWYWIRATRKKKQQVRLETIQNYVREITEKWERKMLAHANKSECERKRARWDEGERSKNNRSIQYKIERYAISDWKVGIIKFISITLAHCFARHLHWWLCLNRRRIMFTVPTHRYRRCSGSVNSYRTRHWNV